MKLKVLPEDFQVEEILTATPSSVGEFSLYRLTKRSIGTPEAIREICQRWRLAPRRVSYGGLKDRHAQTVQHLSIAGGPPGSLQGKLWRLTHLGQLAAPFGAGHFSGNRFTIVLRDLSKPAISRIRSQLEQVQKIGVVNYFDEQRFRSRSPDGRFLARSLIAGDFEQALRLALAEPYAHDRAGEKAVKETLRRGWGDWPLLAASLPGGHPAARVVRHLVSQPGDFRGAFPHLPHEMQSLYLSAYQSWLWNKIAARLVRSKLGTKELRFITSAGEQLPTPRRLSAELEAEWQTLELPLPSARLRLEAGDPLAPIYHAVLAEEQLSLPEMKIEGLRTPFFSKGLRRLFLIPEGMEQTKARDDRYEGRWKLTLKFQLPRGAYATMLVKRVTDAKG